MIYIIFAFRFFFLWLPLLLRILLTFFFFLLWVCTVRIRFSYSTNVNRLEVPVALILIRQCATAFSTHLRHNTMMIWWESQETKRERAGVLAMEANVRFYIWTNKKLVTISLLPSQTQCEKGFAKKKERQPLDKYYDQFVKTCLLKAEKSPKKIWDFHVWWKRRQKSR